MKLNLTKSTHLERHKILKLFARVRFIPFLISNLRPVSDIFQLNCSHQYSLSLFLNPPDFPSNIHASYRANRLDRVACNPSENAVKKAIVRRTGRAKRRVGPTTLSARTGKSNNARPTTPCEMSSATSVR